MPQASFSGSSPNKSGAGTTREAPVTQHAAPVDKFLNCIPSLCEAYRENDKYVSDQDRTPNPGARCPVIICMVMYGDRIGNLDVFAIGSQFGTWVEVVCDESRTHKPVPYEIDMLEILLTFLIVFSVSVGHALDSSDNACITAIEKRYKDALLVQFAVLELEKVPKGQAELKKLEKEYPGFSRITIASSQQVELAAFKYVVDREAILVSKDPIQKKDQKLTTLKTRLMNDLAKHDKAFVSACRDLGSASKDVLACMEIQDSDLRRKCISEDVVAKGTERQNKLFPGANQFEKAVSPVLRAFQKIYPQTTVGKDSTF